MKMDTFHFYNSSTVENFRQQFSSATLWISLASAMACIIPLIMIHLMRRPYYKSQLSSTCKLPPGTLGLPLFGETFQFLGALRANKLKQFFDERIGKFGDIFVTSLTGYRTIVVCGARGNRLLLSNENTLVVVSWPTSFLRLMGQDSILSKIGEDHRIIRAAVEAMLSGEALQGYTATISSAIKKHIDEKWKVKDEVRVLPMVRQIIFSIATSLFFGIYDDKQREELFKVLQAIMAGCMSIPLVFPGTQYNRALKAREKLDKVLTSLLEKKRSELRSGTASPKKDFLYALLTFRDERGNPLTDKEIIDNLAGLVHASYDTTSSPLVLMFKLLAANPECYHKMAQEQLEIHSNKKEGEDLTLQDVRSMKYSWQVVQETLRMFSPSFGTFREAITDIEYDGYTIPKGWKVLWTPYTTHRSEEYFIEADKFNPSRFDDALVPFTFLPFGAGCRRCPGWEFTKTEILLFMHHFVNAFSGYKVVDPDEKISATPVPPLPVNGCLIKLFLRSEST